MPNVPKPGMEYSLFLGLRPSAPKLLTAIEKGMNDLTQTQKYDIVWWLFQS